MHWSPACIYLLVYKVVFPPQPTCLWAEQATNFHPPLLLLRLAIFLPLSWKTDERRKKKKVWENDWGRKGKERQMGFTLSLSLSLLISSPLCSSPLSAHPHTRCVQDLQFLFSRALFQFMLWENISRKGERAFWTIDPWMLSSVSSLSDVFTQSKGWRWVSGRSRAVNRDRRVGNTRQIWCRWWK